MKVEDLDEFQGVTPHMVRAAAEARGFIYRDNVLHYPNDKVALFFATNPRLQGHVVALIAEHLKVSPQAFLQEINPRLRKGVPSEAARKAHNGYWLAVWDCVERSAANFWDAALMDMFATHDIAKWSFWPCDEHGNKVRWPERDGVML